MNKIVKTEELALLLLGIFLVDMGNHSWKWFAICFFLPDVSMLGYLGGNRIGAVLYNIFHYRFLAVILYLTGILIDNSWLSFAGLTLFCHIAFDRMLGYGLKYNTGFKDTHLGKIGKQ
ncbi:DUF4260 domain-containing protein [Avrilella dinanensis]|uniref:DUF4260 domain-containing protein n=1 Tax=Avrilella dinanensis TaxID=2008672 RepID=UPI0024093C49|nr:DUF4260 domain-containing protein [Avrilella dinanensis]